MTFKNVFSLQIKTTLRFHLIPVRIAISKTPPTTCVGEETCGEKGTLVHY
jgi:hypothetical protein